MKVSDLISYLKPFKDEDELVIDVYDTISQKLLDSTADITYEGDTVLPTLKIDVEINKLLDHKH